MALALRKLLLLTFVVVFPQSMWAQQSKEITIKEPEMIELSDLFKMADAVVLAKVISGDTENYSNAVYKGQVLKSFKGASAGDILFFGPYEGQRLGSEYILFLHNAAEPIAPKTGSHANYGTVRYSEVFNEGYSAMETSYGCMFDGKTIPEQCDNGVRVCTDYIVLPKSLRTFPPVMVDTPFGCRWVRKEAFISVLGTFHESKK